MNKVRFALIALILVAFATAALADPADYPIRWHSGVAFTGSGTMEPYVQLGLLPGVDADNGDQWWQSVLFARPQPTTRWRCCVTSATAIRFGTRQLVVIGLGWRGQTEGYAALGVDPASLETHLLEVRAGTEYYVYKVVAAGQAIRLIWSQGRRGRTMPATRMQQVAWPPAPIARLDPILSHLLLRQQVVAEAFALVRRLNGPGLYQITWPSPQSDECYQPVTLRGVALLPADLELSEDHQLARISFKRSGPDQRTPSGYCIFYNFRQHRLVAPFLPDQLHDAYQ